MQVQLLLILINGVSRIQRPNLYLQIFLTEDWSVLMTNSSHFITTGTVGHRYVHNAAYNFTLTNTGLLDSIVPLTLSLDPMLVHLPKA